MGYLGRSPTPSPIDSSDIPDNSIDASKIIDGAIAVADIADDAITPAKISVMQSTATSNLGLGTGAVDSITTGDYNVGVGDYALTSVTEGSQNIAIGYQTLRLNTTGNYNTAVGLQSLYSNTSGGYNVAIGKEVLRNNTTGANNTATGYYSLYSNTTGANNTATGFKALYSNTTGHSNTASGYQALFYNTTGHSNVASGYQALRNSTTSTHSTAMGNNAGDSITTGNWNTAIGSQALHSVTTGESNTAVGSYALDVATGNHNNAIGVNALGACTSGSQNQSMGYGSAAGITTGNSNITIGHQAGDNITTGSSNIIIGSGVDAPSATASNQLNIGNTIYGNTSTGNVGIGTTTELAPLSVASSAAVTMKLTKLNTVAGTGNLGATLEFNHSQSASDGADGESTSAIIQAQPVASWGGILAFSTKNADGSAGNAPSERMRIDSAGDVLVGKTAVDTNTAGFHIGQNGFFHATRDAGVVCQFNRQTSDGEIIRFRKDGTTIGSIGAGGARAYFNFNNASNFGLSSGTYSGSKGIYSCDSAGAFTDGVIDLGRGLNRFDDIYATNGTIQTSDRNEKQDIEELSEAEQRVAVACKGLMRKFRWKDKVAEKGDDARIHFGIIAQDLQDAFAAEGLDAGRYAMFISTTWYEKEVEVPAVEAVEAVEATYDDEGAELTPAVEEVEAKDAYTRTDTEDEPTDGYTERTRLGVRYPELLAFIISAI